MSGRSKVVLGLSVVLTAATVAGVHMKQRQDQQRLLPGPRAPRSAPGASGNRDEDAQLLRGRKAELEQGQPGVCVCVGRGAVEPGWPGVDAGRWVSHCKQACLRGTAPGARGAEMQQALY
ncbi:uncharacterized protein LOC132475994 isoform X2 [Mesoplodon densirostris]|uniref:uncharacterized protein LOC132475994 isoform X2 n=1 Tax=Mesoplodon densirostris TaxID=48708 RepID=UPI0028DCC51F|nr:uncharacterized protein LOC132475994 isoform X2 [Mesoplodon densirostris]